MIAAATQPPAPGLDPSAPRAGAGLPLLEARDLVKHYPLRRGVFSGRSRGAIRALDGVSLEVMPGETLGIVGETGCGKSTLARVIARLIEPTAGTIRFEGREITHLGGAQLKRLRREIQLIFQDPYASLNPRRTVGAIVGEPLSIHRLEPARAARRRRVQELLETVGLGPEHHSRYPHEFSGGQRQRIGLARALALRPRLLIADEPVSALDVSIRAQVLNLLRELQQRFGLTLLLIAHDLSVVRHMCDRVAVMYMGKIVELGPCDSLYARPAHPYTAALLAAVPVLEPPARGPDSAGAPSSPADASGVPASVGALRGELPSSAEPPSGCRFRTRCPKAAERCAREEPRLAGTPGHGASAGTEAACHYPLTSEELEAIGVGSAQ